MQKQTDFLIIGSGLPVLRLPAKVADQGKVIIITKANAEESNTKYAQGGIAGVMHGPDTFEKHVQDTLECGAGLCNEKNCTNGGDWRCRQDPRNYWMGNTLRWNEQGEFDLAKEGGHSEHRVLHFKDATGTRLKGLYSPVYTVIPTFQFILTISLSISSLNIISERKWCEALGHRMLRTYALNLQTRGNRNYPQQSDTCRHRWIRTGIQSHHQSGDCHQVMVLLWFTVKRPGEGHGIYSVFIDSTL